MTERFIIENNNGEVCIKDNLTKKYPFAYVCEEIDMQDSMISECLECSNILNQLWEQTQRFEKHNKDLTEENEQLKQINRNLGDFRNFITEQNVSNEKQRKELQLQMLRLYNYFENWFEDTMSPNAFSEMWDNVKEDKKWEKR